jgi:hypothetical protein
LNIFLIPAVAVQMLVIMRVMNERRISRWLQPGNLFILAQIELDPLFKTVGSRLHEVGGSSCMADDNCHW